MPLEVRAKQFMPFAALVGFEREIEKKEKMKEDRRVLSEDRMEELDWTLKKITEESNVSIIYLCGDEYVQEKGWVVYNDIEKKTIRVSDSRIKYEDIYDIEIL